MRPFGVGEEADADAGADAETEGTEESFMGTSAGVALRSRFDFCPPATSPKPRDERVNTGAKSTQRYPLLISKLKNAQLRIKLMLNLR